MVRTIVFLFFFSIASCSGSGLQKEFAGASAVLIKFYPVGEEIEKIVETDNKDAIANISRFIVSTEEKDKKCTFDGFMEFLYPNGVVRTVQFSLDPKCKQFIAEVNTEGKITAFKMSEEAADFFIALRKGQPVY